MTRTAQGVPDGPQGVPPIRCAHHVDMVVEAAVQVALRRPGRTWFLSQPLCHHCAEMYGNGGTHVGYYEAREVLPL